MAVTVWDASPPANVGLNLGADIGFDASSTLPTAPILHNARFDLGTAPKAASDGIIYVMFEIDEPIGTTFDSVKLDLSGDVVLGSVSLPFMMGLLAKDGLWNVQPESNAPGVNVYVTRNLFPRPASATDAVWASGAASITGTLAFPSITFPRHITWGSVGSGSDFEDDQLLTDFQTAFVANESNRTVARGVPFLFFFRQNVPAPGTINRFFSQNAPVVADRPVLTLSTVDSFPVPVSTIVTIGASSITTQRGSTAQEVVNAVTSQTVSVSSPQIDAGRDSATVDVTQEDTSIDTAINEEG